MYIYHIGELYNNQALCGKTVIYHINNKRAADYSVGSTIDFTTPKEIFISLLNMDKHPDHLSCKECAAYVPLFMM